MSIKEINKQIAARRAKIQELYKPILDLEIEIKQLSAERMPLIKKGKFKWRDKEYSVSDIQILNNYYYENCPYTPQYVYSNQSIEFRQPGEPNHKRISLCATDRCIGNFEKHLSDYREFLDYFEKKFGTSVFSVIEVKDNKN